MSSYTVKAKYEDDQLRDVVCVMGDRTWHLAGRRGADSELELLKKLGSQENVLPVFLGSGLGRGIEEALQMGCEQVVVVDREEPILEVTGCQRRLEHDPRVLWLKGENPQDVLDGLSRWQWEHPGFRIMPLALPFYLRLDPDFYRVLHEKLTASYSIDFWSRARYGKFTSWPPRVLLLTSTYFLLGEMAAACQRMGVPHMMIDIGGKETGRSEFIEELLQAAIRFKPDFVLTINHLGVDREGVLMDLLDRLELPLASWFVDNPHLILSLYEKLKSPWSTIFTWDADNLDSLRSFGYDQVHFLPLATDTTRFHPGLATEFPGNHPWRSRVSFVGNSMIFKVGARMKAGKFPRKLLISYREVARQFGRSDCRSVRDFLPEYDPGLAASFETLESLEQQLSYETMITWESTRQYRKGCVEQTLDFNPLIVGDRGWEITFRHDQRPWRYHCELSYYEDLPRFYPLSEINFNCTSMQMKGAVNQRVFDVPACGSFVLTDYREQMEELFEPGREVAFYRHPEEAGELIRFYRDNPAARLKIARAGRKRVLASHTYEQRLQDLFTIMARIYS